MASTAVPHNIPPTTIPDNTPPATIPHNTAAWALKPKSRPFVVSSAPYTPPPPGYVAIKVVAVAINPIDWIMQDQNPPNFSATYPAIFGSDIAGEIVQIGDGVEGRFSIREKVIAHAQSLSTHQPSHGAFQQFALVPALATAPYPPHLAPTAAAVLPLSLSTAAAGLYPKTHLALPLPSNSHPPKPLNRTLLIWGGSSSVGSSAIQLARASGATVYATASRANFAHCLRLGAEKVFDYHRQNVEDELVSALQGKTLAGVYHAAGPASAVLACARVAERCEGKAIVVSVHPAPKEGVPGSVRVRAISSSAIFAPGGDGVGRAVWGDFLPGALREGVVVPAPEPFVVGKGLRSVQRGLDVLRKGVSARKVVVEGVDGDASRDFDGVGMGV